MESSKEPMYCEQQNLPILDADPMRNLRRKEFKIIDQETELIDRYSIYFRRRSECICLNANNLCTQILLKELTSLNIKHLEAESIDFTISLNSNFKVYDKFIQKLSPMKSDNLEILSSWIYPDIQPLNVSKHFKIFCPTLCFVTKVFCLHTCLLNTKDIAKIILCCRSIETIFFAKCKISSKMIASRGFLY
ncbi:unnamed protein product [Moneuplotes crassus]|uniref:Uncharacterized protein n=1 Tax=Euplotes crassus TaxID=5936 RepID=A0AAD2D8N0_EUPCR|nr:unnamed protein product [Moneuplotes crassus]